MKYYLGFFVILLMFFSCKKSESSVCYKIIQSTDNLPVTDSLFFNTDNYLTITNGQNFSLIDEEGHYLAGKVMLDKNVMTLNIGKNKNIVLNQEELNNNWIKLSRSGKNFVVVADTDYVNKENYILSKEKNWFREKPKNKESKEQIKSRLIANLDMLIDYFDKTTHDESEVFSTRFLTAPVEFYNNGIGITNYDETSAVWKGYFYDDEDAKIAHELLTNSLKGIIEYPKKTTFTEGYLVALTLMRDYLKL